MMQKINFHFILVFLQGLRASAEVDRVGEAVGAMGGLLLLALLVGVLGV